MGFNRTLTRNIGTTLTTIRDAAGATGATNEVILGARVTNTTNATIKVSACITAADTFNYNLIGDVADNANSGVDIPAGSSLVFIAGDADKVVLLGTDFIKLISSAANSCDTIVSVLEN